MWPKLLYLELRDIRRFLRPAEELVRRGGGLIGMSSPLPAGRPLPPRHASKVQLLLRTPEGAGWGLTLSRGMERFIGHYPRVAGLGSGGPLLRYKNVKAAERG